MIENRPAWDAGARSRGIGIAQLETQRDFEEIVYFRTDAIQQPADSAARVSTNYGFQPLAPIGMAADGPILASFRNQAGQNRREAIGMLILVPIDMEEVASQSPLFFE